MPSIARGTPYNECTTAPKRERWYVKLAGVIMRVLYVGFQGKNNASYRLVSSINGEKLFLTNSFQGVIRDIDQLSNAFDRVFLFGIDKRLSNSVRIEKCAEMAHHTVYSKLDLGQMQAAFLARGLISEISAAPTHYLCNEAYYRMLVKFNGNVVLIHIPGIKNSPANQINGIVSKALIDFIRSDMQHSEKSL